MSFTLNDKATLCAKASGIELARIREIDDFARERGESLLDAIVGRMGVDSGEFVKELADELGLDSIINPIDIDVRYIAKVPATLAIRSHVIPVGESENGVLRIATCEPFDWQLWDELAYILSRPIEKVLCPKAVIGQMLTASYGIGADTVEHLVADHDDEVGALEIDTQIQMDLSEEDAANEPTVVNLVNRILVEAIRASATDIHFEPYETKYRVRYRIDGMLEDVSMPVSVKMLKLALVSRIKIMANLDITEKRLPQDGRAQVTLGGQGFDLRVSILPGVYGEAVNIRLQSRHMVKLQLEELGFEKQERDKIEKLITQPHGLVLVTGPTGSGKTTTLYTCLSQINHADNKIITVEDPVEYWMEDILQMQVRDEIGFTFARALRSILRHDPDVVLVGEIRDRETADIAIRASLTGHLVFATLHTNDAASAVTRLLDIGIEPFLVASSLTGVVAQRLVRKICSKCSVVKPIGSDLMQDSVVEGQGCEACRFTGYRGRSAIAEVLNVTPEMRNHIQNRDTADVLKELAVSQGMRTLRENAIQVVKVGRTTTSEMMRVTLEDY